MTQMDIVAVRRLRVAGASAALAFVLLGSPAAHAQSTATAVQLFDEAEALLGQGKYAEACPKYAESYRQDPQLGVLLYLAECYEKNDQLASAWGAYREAEELAQKKNDPRLTQAHERVTALEPRLSRLTVDVPAGTRIDGLEVTSDGVSITAALSGAAIPVDSGKHHIEASAPGYEPWVTEVQIAGERASIRVRIPQLKKVETETGSALAPERAPFADNGSTQRMGAIALGGLGLAAIGVAGFFGLTAQNKQSDSNQYCNAQNICEERGVTLREDAEQRALIATISSAVGVVALGGAGVLWFTAPGPEEEEPSEAQASTKGFWSLNFGGTF